MLLILVRKWHRNVDFSNRCSLLQIKLILLSTIKINVRHLVFLIQFFHNSISFFLTIWMIVLNNLTKTLKTSINVRFIGLEPGFTKNLAISTIYRIS